MHASAGPAAGCWEGSPVALRAPYEPSQQRTKTERRSVTDVLIHGVTHVMIQNSFSPAATSAKEGALAPEAALLYCGRIFISWVLISLPRTAAVPPRTPPLLQLYFRADCCTAGAAGSPQEQSGVRT